MPARVFPTAMNPTYRAVLSPCVGICALDEQGICLGCHRSAAEIASWPHMNDDQRLRLMESLQLAETPARQAVRV